MKSGRRGLGSLPRPKLQPGAIHALLWMLYMAEVTQYGVPHQLVAAPPDDGSPPAPGQVWGPAPLPLPPVPSCCCRYALWYVPDAPGPYIRVDVPGVGMRAHVWAFKVSPFCPHHGQGVWLSPIFGDDEGPDVLDEDERRGH